MALHDQFWEALSWFFIQLSPGVSPAKANIRFMTLINKTSASLQDGGWTFEPWSVCDYVTDLSDSDWLERGLWMSLQASGGTISWMPRHWHFWWQGKRRTSLLAENAKIFGGPCRRGSQEHCALVLQELDKCDRESRQSHGCFIVTVEQPRPSFKLGYIYIYITFNFHPWSLSVVGCCVLKRGIEDHQALGCT